MEKSNQDLEKSVSTQTSRRGLLASVLAGVLGAAWLFKPKAIVRPAKDACCRAKNFSGQRDQGRA